MHRKLQIFLSVALGAALLMAPSLGNIGSESIYDSAFAAKGGNGKGNGGQNGNGNGKSANSSSAGGSSNSAGGSSKSNGANKSASLGTTSVSKSKKEKSLTSQMGALNAAHASAQAFANPNPNSRVGRIKEAVIQNAAAEAAAIAATTAAATAKTANDAVTAKEAEIKALQDQIADPATLAADLLGLQTQLDTATTELGELQATAKTANDAAAAAQTAAEAAQAVSDAAWDAAANKAITDDVKQATIDLVGDKVDTSTVTTPVPTAPTPTPTP
jgi:hypothetical protein